MCTGGCVKNHGACVADNAIGDDGAAALAAALKENLTLTTLHVEGEYERHEVVVVARIVHWRLCKHHVVLVSQTMALVLTVQQRWQRR
jgi:hypothetical protein